MLASMHTSPWSVSSDWAFPHLLCWFTHKMSPGWGWRSKGEKNVSLAKWRYGCSMFFSVCWVTCVYYQTSDGAKGPISAEKRGTKRRVSISCVRGRVVSESPTEQSTGLTSFSFEDHSEGAPIFIHSFIWTVSKLSWQIHIEEKVSTLFYTMHTEVSLAWRSWFTLALLEEEMSNVSIFLFSLQTDENTSISCITLSTRISAMHSSAPTGKGGCVSQAFYDKRENMAFSLEIPVN